jgi:hypothetical protein
MSRSRVPPLPPPSTVCRFRRRFIEGMYGNPLTLVSHSHCLFMGVDPAKRLAECQVANFRVYLHWRVDTGNISQQSSIVVEWKRLRMVYAREVGRRMDLSVGDEVYSVGLPCEPLLYYIC